MPNFSPYAVKLLLDFIGGGAAVTQPSQHWVGLAWGTPTTDGGSELNTSMGYSRMSATFGAAQSPVCNVPLAAPLTFSRFSSAVSALGVLLFDGSTIGANMLAFGTLQTAHTLGVNDSLVVPSLTITLA